MYTKILESISNVELKPSPKKILIIDDERPVALALELKLKHAGFDTMSARNGEEGLEILEKEKFSLILLDLMMPKIDGFKVLETLKLREDKTPVMVLSNLGQMEDEIRAKKLGAVGFFVKSNTPLSSIVERLKEKLDNLL